MYIHRIINTYVYIYIWGISLGSRLLLRLRLCFRTCAMSGTVETKSTAEQPDARMDYIPAVPGDTATGSTDAIIPLLGQRRGPTGSTDSMGELMSTATNAGLVQACQVAVSMGNTSCYPLSANVGAFQWEIQVDFSNGMWWTMPHWLSDPILQVWQKGYPMVSFIWDWKGARNGSYKPHGQTTLISRYTVDFDTMYQRNIDQPDKGDRKVKIVSVIR